MAFRFCSRATLEFRNDNKQCCSQMIDLPVMGIILTRNTKGLFFGIIEHMEVQKPPSCAKMSSPHWCMLHAFWSIYGIHPPNISTFSGSHSDAAYCAQVCPMSRTLLGCRDRPPTRRNRNANLDNRADNKYYCKIKERAHSGTNSRRSTSRLQSQVL
jgi:hypothetical protein